MSHRTDHPTDDVITQFLRARSADPDLSLLDDIMRTVGATPQDRPWLGLRPILLPRRTLLIVAIALLLATMGAIAVGSRLLPDLPGGPFLGTWVTTDPDGSTLTMVIRASGGEEVEIEVHDDLASVCSGAPSTMTGTGRLEGETELVVPSPAYTCDDGSEPEALSGPPLQEQLRDLTLVHDPETDTLTDNIGSVWERAGAEDPSPEPNTSGPMWPQSSVDEVREAQELADAGDPAYTWQVDPRLTSEEWWGYLREPGAEIVERFLREELGWDHALFNPFEGGTGAADAVIRGVVYLRCAPGETNPLYPIAPDGHQEAPGAERCAPTIDGLHYETVSLDLSQLDRRGPDGIWVVSRWAMSAPFAQTDPNIAEAETTALLEEFLGARIAGEGAEGYVEVAGGQGFLALDEVPLLYATTAGAPYERYEIERVRGPWWPYGEMEFTVRLFANGGGTVVEQPIASRDVGGARLTLVHDAKETTENGQPVDVPYEFFDGEVTAFAAPPWEASVFFTVALTLGDERSERIELVGDPLPVATGCEKGPAPTGANALAASIQADPDFEATAPVAVSVGGTEGLAMDVTVAPGASVCSRRGSPLVLAPDEEFVDGLYLEQGSRMRLYLVDLPEGSTTRILAIAIVAPESRFERVLEAAAPIVDSFEFHAP